MATGTQTSKTQRLEVIERLQEWIHPGDKVYTSVTHVSYSGMTRHIKVTAIKDNEPIHLSYNVARALDLRLGNNQTVKVSGCGMDMGFALVYDLSHTMFPDGFDCIGSGCPSNDHSNGDRDYEPHNHRDGGYALIQRWL